MLIDIKVPELAESIAEATVMTWEKSIGDYIEIDEKLVDLETDKVVLEILAANAGRLVEICHQEGITVESNTVLARIDTTASADIPAPVVADSDNADNPVSTVSPTLKTSPAVRKIATEQGRNPAQVPHQGNRVTKADIIAATAPNPIVKPNIPPPSTATNSAHGRPQERVPMTRLRRRTAERLLQAQQQAAILTTFNEVNMQPIMALRSQHKVAFEKTHGVKLGFMSFFVKASVAALHKFPLINASIEGDDILYHGFYDIGIAVSSPRGLVVPILRDVDKLGFAGIEQGISVLGQKSRDSKLALSDLEGGTFSITNGGIFGSMLSTPILNPPQSAILGMHNIVERPVAENGKILIRPIMYLALSYDHRIVDGKEAVQFLVEIKQHLEDPTRLLLDL